MTSTLQEMRQGRPEAADAWPRPVTDDLAYLRNIIVNVYFSGLPGAVDRDWVLIDAGLPGSANAIVDAAARRFGPGARPSAILLTHGHFDHVGASAELAEAWDAPVFAHPLEMPYLTGRSPYPPPDPTVGGGSMASLVAVSPRTDRPARPGPCRCPEDGSRPLHARLAMDPHPGTHPRPRLPLPRLRPHPDRRRRLRDDQAGIGPGRPRAAPGDPRPAAYFTPDWPSARRVGRGPGRARPELAATGHGIPMAGPELRAGLDALLRDFDRVAYPEHGRYAPHPATFDEGGIVSVPPEKPGLPPALVVGLGAGLALGLALGALRARSAGLNLGLRGQPRAVTMQGRGRPSCRARGIVMPVHDWTRVNSGLFHAFHQQWIAP